MAATSRSYPRWPISPQHTQMHQGFFAPASPCVFTCASWQQQHSGGWINQLFPMQAHPQTFGTPAMQIMQPQRQHLKTAAPSPRGPQSSSIQRGSLPAPTPESKARKDPVPLLTVARRKPPLTTRSSLSFSVTKTPGIMIPVWYPRRRLLRYHLWCNFFYYRRCRSALFVTYTPLIFLHFFSFHFCMRYCYYWQCTQCIFWL